jgi:hypothetical protein
MIPASAPELLARPRAGIVELPLSLIGYTLHRAFVEGRADPHHNSHSCSPAFSYRFPVAGEANSRRLFDEGCTVCSPATGVLGSRDRATASLQPFERGVAARSRESVVPSTGDGP